MKRLFYLICIAVFSLANTAMLVCATEYITDIIDLTDDISGNDIDVSGNDLDDYEDDFGSDFPGYDDSENLDFADFSDSDYDDILMILNDIMELQAYSSYDGVIPEPYLTYMKDILSWSTIDDKYVAFVSSYYLNNRYYSYYVLALGDITFNGSYFSGSDVDVYTFYPTVTTFSGTNYNHSIQSSFSYSPAGYLCFTDLSSNYPDIRGSTNRYLFIIIIFLALVLLFYTFTKFGIGSVFFRRRPKQRNYTI